jgi:K+-sensing histidine kinase KdpD
MSNLIDDWLPYFRLDKKFIEKGRVFLKIFFEENIEEVVGLNPKYKKAHFKLPERIPINSGNKALFRDAMINLIPNSLKYTKQRDHLMIKIDFFETEKKIQFCTEDNSAGFDMK